MFTGGIEMLNGPPDGVVIEAGAPGGIVIEAGAGEGAGRCGVTDTSMRTVLLSASWTPHMPGETYDEQSHWLAAYTGLVGNVGLGGDEAGLEETGMTSGSTGEETPLITSFGSPRMSLSAHSQPASTCPTSYRGCVCPDVRAHGSGGDTGTSALEASVLGVSAG